MKLESPIGKIHNNLLVTKKNDVWAYFTCPLNNSSSQNKEEQEKFKRDQNQFLQGLARYGDIELCINPMYFGLEERMMTIGKDFDDDLRGLTENIIDRTVSIVERELKLLTQEKFFIGVKLNDVSSAESLKGKGLEIMDGFLSKVLAQSGYVMEIDKEFIERFSIIEENLFQRIGAIRGRRLTQGELIHLNHYNYIRGQKTSLLKDVTHKDNYSITDVLINPSKSQGLLELKSNDGTTYMSILPISNFDKNMRLNHIVEHVQELPFPVEFHVKAHFEPLKGNLGLKGKSSRANKRLKNFAKESIQVGDAEMKSGQLNRFILNDLDNKIDSKVPILKWLGAFVVFGDTEKECKKRVARLIDYCSTLKVEVKHGLSDQILLFHKFLPGESLKMEKNWIHYTTVEGITEMMIGTDNRMGDNTGFPIGRVSTLSNVQGYKPDKIARACRKLVLFNPLLANQPNVSGKISNSPHIALTGPTGGGKSFLAKMILFYCSLMKGKGLYIDPKSEYKEWILKVVDSPYYQKKYPLFVKYITDKFHFVTLNANNPENVGVLDPICFLKGTDAVDTAETIFEQIYNFSTKERAETELLIAIKKMVKSRAKGEKVGMMNIIDELIHSEYEEVRETGHALYQRVDGSILQLAFSYGNSKGLSLTSKVTILEVAGLDIPKATENVLDYTSSQKKSTALLMCLGRFCEQFGLSDRNENTFVLFDEAWIFSSSKGGQKVIKAMRRVGRTYNNMMILITQSINDTKNDDDEGNFGRIFVFDNSSEREEILDHLGLEVTDKNKEWLKNMPQYHCLYLDVYGRVGRMLVYCPYEEVLAMLRTVNENESGVAEEQFVS